MPIPFVKINFLLLLSVVLSLWGCEYRSASAEFEQHLEVCSVAEDNGLLEQAVQACGTALTIAEGQDYGSDQISDLLYRLGRFERQRANFQQAEALMRRSLALEEQAGDQGATGSRLIELALNVAGQGLWLEGAELLERVSPFVDDLTGKDRRAAANAFRGFGVKLGKMGHIAQAQRFQARAQELSGS